MLARVSMLALLSAASGLALAHSAPNSFVRLAFGAHSVTAEVLVPESELAIATRAEHPDEAFANYLLRHLSAESSRGSAWTVRVQSVRGTTYFDHAYLSAQLELTPPVGESPRDLVLTDDAVTHEVRNHSVVVLVQDAGSPRVLGVLQYPARRLEVHRPAIAAAN